MGNSPDWTVPTWSWKPDMFHHWTWRVRDVPALEIGFRHGVHPWTQCVRDSPTLDIEV